MHQTKWVGGGKECPSCKAVRLGEEREAKEATKKKENQKKEAKTATKANEAKLKEKVNKVAEHSGKK